MSKKITKEIILNISKLARIEMSEKEIEKITRSFDPIMEMIDQVNSVDLEEGVQRNFKLKNIMREDILKSYSSENKKEIIKEFPKLQNNYLKTKKILG